MANRIRVPQFWQYCNKYLNTRRRLSHFSKLHLKICYHIEIEILVHKTFTIGWLWLLIDCMWKSLLISKLKHSKQNRTPWGPGSWVPRLTGGQSVRGCGHHEAFLGVQTFQIIEGSSWLKIIVNQPTLLRHNTDRQILYIIELNLAASKRRTQHAAARHIVQILFILDHRT